MSDGFIPTKDKTAAAIITMEGDELTGFLFLTSNERLIDVVNEEIATIWDSPGIIKVVLESEILPRLGSIISQARFVRLMC